MDPKQFRHIIKEELEPVKNDVKRLRRGIEEVKKTLEAHSSSLINIEGRLEGFTDAWKINRAEINKVKKHLGLPAISE